MNEETAAKIRVGIIGLGHIAEHQIKALRESVSNFSLVAVCDRNPARAQIAPEVPFFQKVSDMIASGNIDAVLVSVPNQQHFSVAAEVLSCGCDVLIEKPATETVGEFQELCKIADAKNLLLHTAFHAAFAPDLIRFIDYYERMKLQLGPITAFYCGFYDPYITNGSLSDAAHSLGGSWIDSGINALSVVTRLLPYFEIEELRFTTLPQLPCREIQGSASIIFPVNGEPSGMGLIDTNWSLNINRKSTMLFFGQTGYRILLNHTDQQVVLFGQHGQETILFDASRNLPRLTAHYIGVFDDFHECIKKRRDNRILSLSLMKKLYEED
jgi:D-galactose 1-dehydrogenase